MSLSIPGTTSWITYPTTTLAPDCYNSNDFLCSDGDCITAAWVCDGYNDCKNGDDERKCNGKSCCDIVCQQLFNSVINFELHP